MKEAGLAGVECETVTATRAHPYEAIISVAIQQRCDLIVMTSHGRRGVRAPLLGSETQKVLTHSDIPVLVVRSSVTPEAVSGKEHGTARGSAQSTDQTFIIALAAIPACIPTTSQTGRKRRDD
jgi:hypothetical protein